MTRFFRKQFAKIKQRKVQQNYDSENPPIFSLSPEFTPLTYDQRQLLFFLVKASKEEAYHGEFQWCVETVPASLPPAHFITGIKPVDSKTRLIDRTNPLFQGKDWKMVGKYGQMKTLENAGYISISSFFEHIIDEKNHKEEKWARFCLNQKAYNYYRFMKSSTIRRFFHIIWNSTEKHFVTIIISIISGVVGAVIIKLLLG